MQKHLLIIIISLGTIMFPRTMIAGVTTGLLGLWDFDHCDAQDSSGNGHHGRIQGRPECVPGVDGGSAFKFSPGDDHIRMPNITTPSRAYTYAMWFRPAAAIEPRDRRQDLLYPDNGSGSPRPHISLNYDEEGKVGLLVIVNGDIHDDVKSVTQRWSAERWYHAAFTWDGETFQVYIDGRQENTIRHRGSGSTPRGFVIAIRRDLNFPFNGTIDEVRLYNRALEAEEVAMLGRITTVPPPQPQPPPPPQPQPQPEGGPIFCLYPLNAYFPNLCNES